MQEIDSALQTFTQAFAAVVALALLVTGFFLGRRWMRKGMGDDWSEYGEREDERRFAQRCADYEAAGRIVDVNNGINGMNPGFGNFHGAKGSGLHRGRR